MYKNNLIFLNKVLKLEKQAKIVYNSFYETRKLCQTI